MTCMQIAIKDISVDVNRLGCGFNCEDHNSEMANSEMANNRFLNFCFSRGSLSSATYSVYRYVHSRRL